MHRWILQAVAQGFVIQRHTAPDGYLSARESVPIVNEFVFHFFRFERGPAQQTPRPNPKLVAQRIAVRRLREVWLVNRLAEFAAINFRLSANQRLYFFRVIVPALQVPAA